MCKVTIAGSAAVLWHYAVCYAKQVGVRVVYRSGLRQSQQCICRAVTGRAAAVQVLASYDEEISVKAPPGVAGLLLCCRVACSPAIVREWAWTVRILEGLA